MANLNKVKNFITNTTTSEYKPKRLKSEFIWVITKSQIISKANNGILNFCKKQIQIY